MNRWVKEKQKYVLEYKDIIIYSNCPMQVQAPIIMMKACHPPEPPRETVKIKPKYMQVMNRPNQDRMNTGLGVQQRQVKEKLKQIEGDTGKRIEEVGNDTPALYTNQRKYTVTRDEVQHTKDTVK